MAGSIRFDSTRLRLCIFMHCRGLVTHSLDLVYMPALIARGSQCAAAVAAAAAAAAVHCNT